MAQALPVSHATKWGSPPVKNSASSRRVIASDPPVCIGSQTMY